MNLGKIFEFITENDLNPDDVFQLIERIRDLDLEDETNLRAIIRDAFRISNKEIDSFKEDMIVRKIQRDGINENLLNDLK